MMDKPVQFDMHVQLDADHVTNMAVWRTAVTRAWSDPQFKAKLFADPTAVLAELGMKLPAGVKVALVEDTDTTNHLVFPHQSDVSLLKNVFAEPGF